MAKSRDQYRKVRRALQKALAYAAKHKMKGRVLEEYLEITKRNAARSL